MNISNHIEALPGYHAIWFIFLVLALPIPMVSVTRPSLELGIEHTSTLYITALARHYPHRTSVGNLAKDAVQTAWGEWDPTGPCLL